MLVRSSIDRCGVIEHSVGWEPFSSACTKECLRAHARPVSIRRHKVRVAASHLERGMPKSLLQMKHGAAVSRPASDYFRTPTILPSAYRLFRI